MYNLGMENIVKDKVGSMFEIYKYNVILTLIIFILFYIVGYSRFSNNYDMYLNNIKVKLANDIYTKNSEQYMHIDDLTNLFKDNIYDDKISGKVIITTFNKLIKVNKNDENYFVKQNGETYVNLKNILNEIDLKVINTKGKIFVVTSLYAEGIIKNNRTELYDKLNGDVICLLSKENSVNVHIDENVQQNDSKWLSVSVSTKNKTYYGNVLKNNVIYEYNQPNNITTNQKTVMVKADKKVITNLDAKKVDMVAINMYRLSSVNSLTKLEHTIDVDKGIKVLATINNGQYSSNYDSDIITSMLNSEKNRSEIIEQIQKEVANIDGVNLDFTRLKTTDKDKYTQFVKELAATLHISNKLLVVNVTNNIDINEVSKFADFVVIQPYFARTLSSKTSGPISSIQYVEQSIQETLEMMGSMEKVILEIPVYTILWTERRGTVINAEQYNMKMAKEYINSNNIQTSLDNVSGQNYINHTKGITTYKMWLEDEYSVTQKTQFINKYNLGGIAIYKNGMELPNIYDIIYSTLNK